MKFPEISYFLPSLKDQRTQRLEFFRRAFVGVSAAAAGEQVSVSYTVPSDRFAVISDWSIRWTGALAADQMVSAALRITTENQLAYADGKQVPQLAVNVPNHIGSSCEVWLPPGAVVDLVYVLTTATAGPVFAALSGFQVPRGNIVRA